MIGAYILLGLAMAAVGWLTSPRLEPGGNFWLDIRWAMTFTIAGVALMFMGGLIEVNR